MTTVLNNLVFKIIVIGNANTGKSALLNRVTGRIFNNSYTMTIGVDFAIRNIEFEKNGHKNHIKLQIWDTAGQECFRSITRSYYKDAAGVILVYDITNLKSYESLTRWIDDINYYCSQDTQIIISGNKIDLGHIRTISYNEVNIFCKNNTIDYLETSSKTGENVDILFKKLAEKIYDNYITKNLEERKNKLGIKHLNAVSDSVLNGGLSTKGMRMKMKMKMRTKGMAGKQACCQSL